MTSENEHYAETGVEEKIALEGRPITDEPTPNDIYGIARLVQVFMDTDEGFPDEDSTYSTEAVLYWRDARKAREDGDYRSAVQLFRKALAIDPLFLRSRLNLAATLVFDGVLAEAALEYHQVLTLTEGNQGLIRPRLFAQTSLGALYLEMAIRSEDEQKRRYYATLSDMHHAHADDIVGGNDPDILADWAKSVEVLQDFNRALHLWQRALASDPSGQIIAHKLAKYPELMNLTQHNREKAN